jgi:hypothetical protein
VCGGNIVSMFDRVAKLRYCVAHFEHLLHQGAKYRDEMAKVYLAKLMAARAQLAEAARRTGKCAALTARGQDKPPRSF